MILLDDVDLLLLSVLALELVHFHCQQIHHSFEVLALAKLCLEDNRIDF